MVRATQLETCDVALTDITTTLHAAEFEYVGMELDENDYIQLRWTEEERSSTESGQ
jgi:hypothetical protein